MKKIHFYISNNNHHWQMMKPVMRDLLKTGKVKITLLSLCEFRRMDTPEHELKMLEIPYIKLSGLKFRGATTSTGKKHIGGNQAFLRNFLRAIIWRVRLKRHIIKANKERPDLVIVPNDIAYPFDRICKWFTRNHIPYILFQEGIRFPLPNEDGWVNYGNNGAKEILAWGEYSANYFRGLNKKTNVVAAGNPRFDEMLRKDYTSDINRIRKELNLGKYNILYVSNPVDDQGFCSHDEKMNLFRSFLSGIESLMQMEGVKVLVRLHPREDVEAFKEIVDKNYSGKVFFVQQYPLFPCLRVVDLCIVLASTVGLEAMLCETPVAVVKLPKHGFVFNYVSSGCAVGVDVNEKFSPAIWSAMTTQKEDLKKKGKLYIADQLANVHKSAGYISNHLIKALNI